jgi:xylulose-5-phosphate/fructose-6-phosphate phosphoketolase
VADPPADLHERLIEHKHYIARHGDDMPAISGWQWGKSGGGPGAAKRDTAADNV